MTDTEIETPTTTIRLIDDEPAYVTVYAKVIDESIVESGFISDDSIGLEGSIVLSDRIDGYPRVEIQKDIIDLITYRDPYLSEIAVAPMSIKKTDNR